MKTKKPAALTAGPRHHNQDTPSLTAPTDKSQHPEVDAFTYARMTPSEVESEARRIEAARQQKRDLLLALGIPPRNYEDDLTIARALAALDRMPRGSSAGARQFREEVQCAFGSSPGQHSRGEAA